METAIQTWLQGISHDMSHWTYHWHSVAIPYIHVYREPVTMTWSQWTYHGHTVTKPYIHGYKEPAMVTWSQWTYHGHTVTMPYIHGYREPAMMTWSQWTYHGQTVTMPYIHWLQGTSHGDMVPVNLSWTHCDNAIHTWRLMVMRIFNLHWQSFCNEALHPLLLATFINAAVCIYQ